MEVHYSNSVSIRIKARTRGGGRAVLRVHRADDPYNKDPHRLTVSWDHSLNADENAVAAAREYLAQKDPDFGWGGTWVVGGGHSEWAAVMVPEGTS